MQKTSIEWCDETWNPVSGCFHPCRNTYCYNTMKGSSWLRRFGARYRNDKGELVREKDWRSRETGGVHVAKKGEVYSHGFDPTFYPHRLNAPLKVTKASKIFTCDVSDLFGHWVPEDWIDQVLDIVQMCPQHIFQFLTKNPKRYLDFKFPDNAWVGTSINTAADKQRVEIIKKVPATVRYLSIEPLLGPMNDINFEGLQWIIVGAQTGPKAPAPQPEWVDDIVKRASNLGISVFIKENLRPYCQHTKQEFPDDSF